MAELTTQMLITSLKSDFCPICGGTKRPLQTMCPKDYRRLPKSMQGDLYKPIFRGYDVAVKAAMQQLNVTEFQLPLGAAKAK